MLLLKRTKVVILGNNSQTSPTKIFTKIPGMSEIIWVISVRYQGMSSPKLSKLKLSTFYFKVVHKHFLFSLHNALIFLHSHAQICSHTHKHRHARRHSRTQAHIRTKYSHRAEIMSLKMCCYLPRMLPHEYVRGCACVFLCVWVFVQAHMCSEAWKHAGK